MYNFNPKMEMHHFNDKLTKSHWPFNPGNHLTNNGVGNYFVATVARGNGHKIIFLRHTKLKKMELPGRKLNK